MATQATTMENQGFFQTRHRPHVGELVSDLGRQTVTLLRKETELVKAEMEEKITAAKQSAIAGASAGAVTFAGLIVLLFGAVYGLALVVPGWAAALIVGGATLLVGGALLGMAKARSPEGLVPHQTVGEVRKDARMIKEQI